MTAVSVKRAYEPTGGDDGQRVLVDRLWPRGVSKAKAGVDLWLKEIAPSADLRKWFGHNPERWSEFRRRYREELSTNPAVPQLPELMKNGRVTLIYSAKDEARNQAVVLAEYLR